MSSVPFSERNVPGLSDMSSQTLLPRSLQFNSYNDLYNNTSTLKAFGSKLQDYANPPTSSSNMLNLHFITHLAQVVYNNAHWYWIFYALILWEVRRIVFTLWWKVPRNVKIIGYPTPLGKYLTAIRMMYASDTVLLHAYNASNGQPFAVPMLDRYIVFILDRHLAERLEHNTPTNLSEIEALHELASTNVVLGDVKISSERYFKDGVGALKKHLRSNLPAMSQDLQVRVKDAFNKELEQAETCHAKGSADQTTQWRRLHLVPTLLRMVTRVNLPIFVGNELGNRPEIFENLMSFFWNCLISLLAITFIPNFLLPVLAPVLMGWGLSKWKLYGTMLKLAHTSVDGEYNGGQRQVHLVQWVADMMKIRDAIEVAKTSLGLVFGSAFQIPMITQATLYHLCKYPQYLPGLREEATSNELESFKNSNREMPRMDSFVKETARLSPGLILSVPRRAMSTYTLPDGVVVPEGNWVAIPQFPLMRDPAIWHGGTSFSGDRFVDDQGRPTSRFTHPSFEFPYWGSIRHACPARFYASVIVKVILTRLLCHYEFKLENPGARLFFSFGMIRLTNPFMTLLVREREVGMHGPGNP